MKYIKAIPLLLLFANKSFVALQAATVQMELKRIVGHVIKSGTINLSS